MNKTFVEEIRNAVAEALKDKIVEVKEMEKGNGVVYTGITIRTEGNNIAPNIYINEDLSVEDNVENILEAYRKSGSPSIDVSFFTDYEKVKEKLAILLTSKPMKDLATEKAPGFDDLYMHAYVSIHNDEIGNGNIKIRNDMLEKWGITSEQLFKDALEAAQINAPSERKSMFETLCGMGVSIEDVPMPFTMDVLSNTFKLYGASAILYTDVTENTYMIPSSIHEVILINGDTVDEMNLNQMIKEVNATQVEPEERLSNHAYRFNGTEWESVA